MTKRLPPVSMNISKQNMEQSPTSQNLNYGMNSELILNETSMSRSMLGITNDTKLKIKTRKSSIKLAMTH